MHNVSMSLKVIKRHTIIKRKRVILSIYISRNILVYLDQLTNGNNLEISWNNACGLEKDIL